MAEEVKNTLTVRYSNVHKCNSMDSVEFYKRCT